MRSFFQWICVIGLFAVTGCVKSQPLGSVQNPVKLYFVPSVDVKIIETNAETFKNYLQKKTGYQFEITIPQSYIAVVEAFGTKRADVCAINTFGYILAHEKYGAEARLTVVRNGLSTYQSEFLARADGPIQKLEDLQGRKVAFVDPASASGYLLPLKTLKDRKIEPKETVFAMKHDSVVSMIYQRQVDAGAAYYSPPSRQGLEDARTLVKTQYPDVEQKIKIIELSQPIPNDPIIFRKEMPEDMKVKIVDAFISFLATSEGKVAFREIYAVDQLKRATDQDYDAVRELLTSVGKSADELMSK